MGIYDIFAKAAGLAEKAPWRTRLLGGALAGAAVEGVAGNSDQDIFTRVSKGLFVGSVLGAATPSILRGIGAGASGGYKIGKAGVDARIAAVKAQGWKAMMKPGTLALAGAAAGAAIAPPGYRTQGALIGGGLGLASLPAKSLYKGWNALGKVPGGHTAALITAAAAPVAAGVAFGLNQPETSAAALPGGSPGIIDYTPIEGGMKDRMIAMNASGDLVLGLHGRSHG